MAITTGYIYKITNKINGMVYIGQTIRNPKQRWNNHVSEALSGNPAYISRAIAKYGKDNFELEIIQEVPVELIDQVETSLIKSLNTLSPNGYNLQGGGQLCRVVTEETKIKISSSTKGVKKSEETKIRMRKPKSKEHAENISKATKGKTYSKETKAKISAAKKGMVCSEDLKRKWSEMRLKNKTPFKRINKSTGEEKVYSYPWQVREDGFSYNEVWRVLKGRNMSHKGYFWRYC